MRFVLSLRIAHNKRGGVKAFVPPPIHHVDAKRKHLPTEHGSATGVVSQGMAADLPAGMGGDESYVDVLCVPHQGFDLNLTSEQTVAGPTEV